MDLCMSISMYGRARRTCGRACPHAQPHTYTRIYTHTNWNIHYFFSCVSVTLCLRIEFLLKTDSGYPMDFWVCLFVVMKPQNPYSASRPDGSKVQRNSCFSRLCFFLKKKIWQKFLTSQRPETMIQILFLKRKLGSWPDTQPNNNVRKKSVKLPLELKVFNFILSSL